MLGTLPTTSALDEALQHDMKTFGSSNTIRLYDESIDYRDPSLVTVPLRLAECTGQLVISTTIERYMAEKAGKISLPSFGESLVENFVTGIPVAAIKLSFDESTPDFMRGYLTAVEGLAALLYAGPIAALTVVGLDFLGLMLRKMGL